MYAVVRRGKVKSGSAEELARGVNEVASPVMNSTPGYKVYYLVYGEDNTVVVLSVFDDKAIADKANQQMIGAIVEKLGSLLVSPPETIEDEVIAHRTG